MGRSLARVDGSAGGVPSARLQLPARAIAWIVAVVALPIAELALLSGRFDASTLAEGGGLLGRAAGASGDVVRAVVPMLAAALLFAAARLTQVAPAVRAAYAPGRFPWAALGAHLACFALVAWLSGRVFTTREPSVLLLAAWAAAGVAAAAAWVAALIPGVGRRGPGMLLGGALAGAAGLGVIAAGAASMTRTWWEPLGRFTVQAVYLVLHGLGFDVGAEPDRFLVGTRAFVVEITPYCSGYQGIGLLWVFLGAYLWLFRDRLRFPRVLWLLPIGTVLVWLLNAVRIAALVIIGHAGFADVAVQGFHYHAGTLLFCATALGLAAWAGSSRVFAVSASRPVTAGDNPTGAYVLPLVALLATSLVTGAASSGGFDIFYGLRALVAAAVLWTYRARLAQAGWGISWEGAALGVVAFAVWLALAGRGDLDADVAAAVATLEPTARLGWMALRFAGAVVIVPLVEEIAFRGYLMRRLTAADFAAVSLARVTWPALLASATLFGLMHHDVAAGVAVGVLYGIAARRRGQLGDAVLAHAVTNGLLAAAVLATGRAAF